MTYHVKLQGMVGDNDVERLRAGWRWEGRPVKPTSVERLAATEKNTWVEMVVAETRPRALKAAGDLIRHSVLKIARVRLGGLSFEGLEMGGWRDLTKAEAADLRKRAGLEGDGAAGRTAAVTPGSSKGPTSARSSPSLSARSDRNRSWQARSWRRFPGR